MQLNFPEMLVEALQLFLETCIEDGRLEAVLEESGFRPIREGHDDAEDDADYPDVPVSHQMRFSNFDQTPTLGPIGLISNLKYCNVLVVTRV